MNAEVTAALIVVGGVVVGTVIASVLTHFSTSRLAKAEHRRRTMEVRREAYLEFFVAANVMIRVFTTRTPDWTNEDLHRLRERLIAARASVQLAGPRGADREATKVDVAINDDLVGQIQRHRTEKGSYEGLQQNEDVSQALGEALARLKEFKDWAYDQLST